MRICDDDGNLQYIKYTRFLKDDDSTDDESSDEEVNENDTIYENDISDTQQMRKNLKTFMISSKWENILWSVLKKKIWTRLVITKKTS